MAALSAKGVAALLAKHATGDPTVLPAGEALGLATADAADAFGLAAGRLAPGRLADIVLVDLDHPLLFPGHDLVADGVVADEAEVRAEVRGRLARLSAGTID